MGAGDIFRGVAQGLLGAGSGAANYALERDAELRKQKWMLEQINAQKEHKVMLPIEEEKIRAEINALNRRNTGGGGGGDGGMGIDKRVLQIIKAEEEARGTPYSPREFGKRKAQLLGVSLFKPASQDYTDESTNPLSPIPNAMPSFIPRQSSPAPVTSPPQVSGGSEQEILGLVNSGKMSPEEARARIQRLRQQ